MDRADIAMTVAVCALILTLTQQFTISKLADDIFLLKKEVKILKEAKWYNYTYQINKHLK